MIILQFSISVIGIGINAANDRIPTRTNPQPARHMNYRRTIGNDMRQAVTGHVFLTF